MQSPLALPEVYNWAENVKNNKGELFWKDEIYHFTNICDSLKPFMRFCVDMRVEGKTPRDIARISHKHRFLVYKTLARAKRRFVGAVMR